MRENMAKGSTNISIKIDTLEKLDSPSFVD